MGVDYSANLILGVAVSREELFPRDPESTVLCKKGHVRENSFEFCPQDGTPFKEKYLHRPTPAVLAYAESLKMSPEDLFSIGNWEKNVGIYDGQPFPSSMSDKEMTPVLGIELLTTGSHRGGSTQDAISMSILEAAEKVNLIRTIALKIGIPEDRPIELYLTLSAG